MTHEERLQRLVEIHRELRLLRTCYVGEVKKQATEAMKAVSSLHSALQPKQPKAARRRKPRPAAKVVPHARDAWRAELINKIQEV